MFSNWTKSQKKISYETFHVNCFLVMNCRKIVKFKKCRFRKKNIKLFMVIWKVIKTINVHHYLFDTQTNIQAIILESFELSRSLTAALKRQHFVIWINLHFRTAHLIICWKRLNPLFQLLKCWTSCSKSPYTSSFC